MKCGFWHCLMKRILACCLIFCLLIPLNGCSFGTEMNLEEYADSIDWMSEERPLIGERITFSLTENSNRYGIHFSFHPDLGTLIVLYLSEDSGQEEDALSRNGVVFVMDVEYDSCADLVSRPKWTGVLREVYRNNTILHGNVQTSFSVKGMEDRPQMNPEDIPADCYGSYYPDPEDPDRYVTEGYTDKEDPGRRVGLWVVSKRYGVPWGFQEYVYDRFKIDGLSHVS